MARFEPTASQKCAIEETGRAVLVSEAEKQGCSPSACFAE